MILPMIFSVHVVPIFHSICLAIDFLIIADPEPTSSSKLSTKDMGSSLILCALFPVVSEWCLSSVIRIISLPNARTLYRLCTFLSFDAATCYLSGHWDFNLLTLKRFFKGIKFAQHGKFRGFFRVCSFCR